MKAELLPLTGKYYNTTIMVGSVQIKLCGGEGRPSDREFEEAPFTIEQWEKNEELFDNGWGGKCSPKELDYFDYGHCEKQDTYLIAQKIVDILNTKER